MSRFTKIAGLLFILLIGLGLLLYIVVPRYRFRSIVIHHSASTSDNYASIKAFHRERGWQDAAYHLILSNGSTSVPLGFLEATGRYRLLSYSPATKNVWCNLTGLHLCIVGDYDQQEVPQQLRPPLAHAIQSLQKMYHLDDSQIIFHRDCSPTSCPGRFITKEKITAWLAEEAAKCPPVIEDQQLEVIGSPSISISQFLW